MSNKLTKKQKQLLEYIVEFTEVHGVSPSYREIAAGLGLSSVSAIAEHIDNLVALGAIKKVPGAARSLEVVDLSYPETTALFQNALTIATSDERAVLLQAADILGLDLTASTTSPESDVEEIANVWF